MVDSEFVDQSELFVFRLVTVQSGAHNLLKVEPNISRDFSDNIFTNVRVLYIHRN
jgi:hypothetical protein